MAKEICISSTPHETRLAILEDDQLAEIYYERENEYTLAGSIYNGRVTRVLPGMQSAFVDVGLERDAFLYVTDFLEMEDPEESDELEKAAASGGSQAPREVRHTGGSEGAVQSAPSPRIGGRGDQKSDQKQEQRHERQQRNQRLAIEAVPEVGEVSQPASESGFAPEESGTAQGDSGDGGTKRWRGRRRRRGARPGDREQGSSSFSGSQTETAEPAENDPQTDGESEFTPSIQATAALSSRTSHAPPSGTPVPFVLPGESLSKYGGTPASDAPANTFPAPVRPASTFKPSTLIEAPLAWDGSGLLPGESLSRHRNREPENTTRTLEESAAALDEISEDEFVSERVGSVLRTPCRGSRRGDARGVHFTRC